MIGVLVDLIHRQYLFAMSLTCDQ